MPRHISFLDLAVQYCVDERSAQTAFPRARLLLVLAILPMLSWVGVGLASAQQTIFPGEEWVVAAPEDVWIDSVQLQDAVDTLRENSPRLGAGIDELVLIRHGRVIWQGSNVDHVHMTHSVTKSFATTALGLLVDDGRVSLDTLAQDYVPELAAHYPDVKLRHLATHTSGYLPEGYIYGQTDPPADPLVPGEPLFTPPGSRYAYDQPSMTQLMNVLARAADEPIQDLFQRRIGDAIGLSPENWDWDHVVAQDGTVVEEGGGFPGGVHISAIDMARLGHLILNDGSWEGEQLISREWLAEATQVQVPATVPGYDAGAMGPGIYGYGWWVFDNFVEARGAQNNYMHLRPDLDLVAVRFGSEPNINDWIAFMPVWQAFTSRLDRLILPGIWDESGDGRWDARDPITGKPHWRRENGMIPDVYPTGAAIVRSNMVTIANDLSISSLAIESGSVFVDDSATVSFGSRIDVEKNGAFSVDGAANGFRLLVEGKSTVSPTGTLQVERLTISEQGQLTVQGLAQIERLYIQGGNVLLSTEGDVTVERLSHTDGLLVMGGRTQVNRFFGSGGVFEVHAPSSPHRVTELFRLTGDNELRFLVSDPSRDTFFDLAEGVVPTFSGDLLLDFAPEVDPKPLEGQALKLFNWSADVQPIGEFDQVSAPVRFELDSSQLYSTGEVILKAALARPNVAGDFDGDSFLDVRDLDALARRIRVGSKDLYYDVDDNTQVGLSDVDYWIHGLKQTWLGDANLDGEFNTGDLVQVLGAGKYQTDVDAGWSEGDWNADGIFGTGDLVMALEDGGYEMGPREPVAVPEPGIASLVMIAACFLLFPTARTRLCRPTLSW